MGWELVWIALLAVLAVAAWVVTRRVTAFAGRTRGLEQFQRDVLSIDARMASVLTPLVARLDDLRRLAGDPTAVASDLAPAVTSLEQLAAVGRGLRPPEPLAPRAGVIVAELERALRALDLLDHGLRTALDGRRDPSPEAGVALKRGTLNLRHARDAVGRVVGEITAMRPADVLAMPGGQQLGVVPTIPPPAFSDPPDEA